MGQYVYSIVAAAMICALVHRMLMGKGTVGALGKMLCGVFLVFTIVAPLADVNLGRFDDITDSVRADAAYFTDMGKEAAKKELQSIITGRVEAYILDKAEAYGAQLTVSVTLSDDEIPIPVQVRISGSISPYGKSQLQNVIAEELGIAKEDQLWI